MLLRSLRRPMPTWWSDAKLGIFIHWTPASVPGFAPVGRDIGGLFSSAAPDVLAEAPYAEWYENSLRFPDSSVSRFHREHYGNRPYASFAADFEAGLDGWDPDDWAARFAAAGAKYVVLVTKHHDGFCLWPTEVRNPGRPGWHTRRDVVGELAEAVRARGMRFGVYYSGGLDWTFEDRPIGCQADAVLAIPRGAYPAYAEAQVRELIRRYRPSVVWNDIAWPTGMRRLARLFADYYAAVPDGVVNDRWMPWNPAMRALGWPPAHRVAREVMAAQVRRNGGLVLPTPPHCDYRTPEYTTFDEIQSEPWECVRGIDHSFGFNRASEESSFIPRDETIHSLVDIASKGGNLLLNVGPRGDDASIPDAQARRLEWLAEWTGVASDGLFGTRPWVRSTARTIEGDDLRFTARASTVYATVLGEPAREVTIPGVAAESATTVEVLGHGPVGWSAVQGGLRVRVGEATTPPATVISLENVTAAV